MKIAIFVDKFPVLSQTFVLNQITGLIDLGVDVSIISINSVNGDPHQHKSVSSYNLIQRTTYLNKEPSNKFKKLISRLFTTAIGLLRPASSTKIVKSIHNRFGHHGKSLLLASIIAKLETPIKADVILCHFGYNGILANKLRTLGVIQGKIATIFHGFEISAHSALVQYKNDYQTLFKNSELCLPISDLWQKKLQALGCAANKIKVHRMGVDLNSFIFKQYAHKSKEKLAKDKITVFTLLSVARFTEKKGLEYAFKALSILPSHIKVKYILAGYGELEKTLKILANTLNISDKVEFIGPVNQTQVTELMNRCDVFIQPSITANNGDMEGVPVAIMEAMAIGLPVISTYHSGIPELVIDGESGLLSPEKNAASLRDNIQLLIKDNALRNKLIINARQQIETIADVSKLNKQLVHLLKDIIKP